HAEPHDVAHTIQRQGVWERALLPSFQQEETPCEVPQTLRFYSSQVLVPSSATRQKVASSIAMSSAFRLKRRLTATFIPKQFRAQRVLRCGRFLMRRGLVLAKIPGLKTLLPRRHGLSSMWTVSKRQPRPSNRADIECLLRTRKNRGGKSLAVSSRQKDCW